MEVAASSTALVRRSALTIAAATGAANGRTSCEECEVNRTFRAAVRGLLVCSILLLAACAGLPERGASQDPPQYSSDPLITRLAEGGYVIYFRHGRTDSSFQDKQDKPEWWKSCDTRRHRPLSDEGRAQMLAIGNNLRALRIPVGAVVTSEYCRAVDSGLLLQLLPIRTDPAMNYADAQRYVKRVDADIVAGFRKLLSQRPEPGKNTILVGHVHGSSPPIDPAFSAIQEAEAVVMRPLGDDKFEVLGRLPADRWTLRK